MAKFQLDAILRLVDVSINSQVFRKISQSVAGLPANLQKVRTYLNQSTTSANALNTSLARTGQQLSFNQKTAQLFLQRMAQFAILLPTFATLNRAIQGSVKFLFDFDSALRDIVRVDISKLAGRMEEIGDAAIKTATDFGVLATEVLDVTKIFVQAGLTIEQAQERARLAILATQVSTLESADAVEFFISAATQFNLEGKKLEAALDALVKVEDAAAVEAKDIAEAFRTGGNSMAEFAKDINAGIGLISALREQTRKSGREIGTFFKTLQTRIFAAGESRDAVESLGVTVENLDGSLRPTLQVLNDLKVRFDTLTEAQAANAAKAIAGVRQFESLIATLNSLEKANTLTTIAAQAAGTAEAKRAITDEKLERQLGKLIAQGQALAESIGDAGLEDVLADALKSAASLLKVFTKFAKVIEGIGGNLVPLLALGGLTLGRGVFGFAGGGGGGGGRAPQAGVNPNFIGPPTQQQAQIMSAGKALQAVGNVAKGITGAFKTASIQINLASRGLQGEIVLRRLVNQRLTQHSNAIQQNIKALKQSAIAETKERGFGIFKTGGGALLASLAGTLLPALFGKLSASLRESNSVLAQSTANFVDVAGNGVSMAAQFAILGGKASAVAGAFGVLETAIPKIVEGFNQEIEGRKLIQDAAKEQAQELRAFTKLRAGTGEGQNIFARFLENFQKAVTTTKPGKERETAVTKVFEATGKELGLQSAEQFSRVFLSEWTNNLDKDLRVEVFGTPEGLRGIDEAIKANREVTESYVRGTDATESYNKLLQGAEEGNLNNTEALTLLRQSLGETEQEIDELTGTIKRELNLEAVRAVNSLIETATSIRNLGLELELAKLGPDALADNLVSLEQEFLLLQEASAQTAISLREELTAAFNELNQKGFGNAATKVKDLLAQLVISPESFDPGKISQLREELKTLPEVTQKSVEEVLKILEKRSQNELSLKQKENEVLAEQSRRAKELMEAESQATFNAFAATEKFNAELKSFGDTVSTDILSAFQNISLGDIEDVLAGKSDLEAGLQQLITNAFADPLAKAQLDLQNVTVQTQAELNILAKRLEDVNTKLIDQSHAEEFAKLTAEKRSIELEIETTKQKQLIDSTEAKIKVLEEEREAAEKAAEAEKKRAELQEKLADASRAFEKEMRDIERSFKEFTEDRIADLLGQEADAREELKDAQKEVIDSSRELSEAYDNLIRAQLEFNGLIAEARIKSNLLGRDIGALTGSIVSFSDNLNTLQNSFRSILNDANISLEKRIELERQLAEETLSFLQKAQDEIVQAGIGVFGQTGTENRELGQGIAGLQFIADQLGGSFERFLSFTQGELSAATDTLLRLPTEFRQQILSALSFLPSTVSLGGFSVEQLTQAIGQIGAGVAPEVGLPSIEELTGQQVEQLIKLQELALQDAQLQISQVIAAQEQLAAAEEAAEAAQILEERASEGLIEVRDAVLEEKAILDLANQERRDLLAAVISADDRNSLLQIEKEAQLFADQNAVFREVGDQIVHGVASAISARLAVIEAATNVNAAFKGYIPHFTRGNLTPDEATGLLRAAAREKRSMPAGAGLAVANTSEAIIPMSHGLVPNFQEGNFSSPIAAGIAAVRQVNETVVAAISRSVTEALSTLQDGGGNTEELLSQVISQLTDLNDTLDEVNASNTIIQSNTTSSTTGGTATTAPATASDVTITLQTNQNNTVTITGLENLRNEIRTAVRQATSDQVDQQLESLLTELDNILTVLQERGLINSLGGTR